MGRSIVGMLSSYGNITQSDWLWNQTPEPFGVWRNIQILKDAPRPDFLLLYNFHDFYTRPPRNRLLRRLQPSRPFKPEELETRWRGVTQARMISLVREPPFEEKLKQRSADYEQAQRYCGYVSGPDDLAPVPDYMPAIWYVGRSFAELNSSAVPTKIRSCSWVTSGISRTANHRKRLNFIRQLQDHPVQFDLYGRDLPDWAKSQGTIADKWHALAPYYYNLAIENYAENDWYVSEKLWDALLSWCLPIYYGGTAADKLLPPGSFVRLPSLDEKGLALIQEITASPDAWYAAKDAIAEARQIILHKLNLVNWLSEFVDRHA
ncbi:glycosyltransferase family 10 domain-containing protein [Leptolyngbya ohadii]|uniref:glycosyltransferase family 10 domain-containing protein n=1 Tax=Leptolyngbya ohadii TaxID=1962290 RepID=UPI000B59E7D0|nr:glycosyltransferase family 10 [Leptolyngbya ohadii]